MTRQRATTLRGRGMFWLLMRENCQVVTILVLNNAVCSYLHSWFWFAEKSTLIWQSLLTCSDRRLRLKNYSSTQWKHKMRSVGALWISNVASDLRGVALFTELYSSITRFSSYSKSCNIFKWIAVNRIYSSIFTATRFSRSSILNQCLVTLSQEWWMSLKEMQFLVKVKFTV